MESYNLILKNEISSKRESRKPVSIIALFQDLIH